MKKQERILTRTRIAGLVTGIIVPVVICSLVSTSLGREPVAHAAIDCSTATASSLGDPLTAGVWQQIMTSRASLGLPAFTWSPTLAQASGWMACDAASRFDVSTTVDSLGRDMRPRDTAYGYRTDAQVGESLVRVWTTDPVNVWNLWQGNDPVRMFWILHSSAQYPPVYAVGALGHYHDSSSGADFWVMDAGTLADNTTGTAATATPTPTTAAPAPQATATPTSTDAALAPQSTSTATSTQTNTPVPPTATPTRTNTSIPATATSTATNTSVPPTATASPTPTDNAAPSSPPPPTPTASPTKTKKPHPVR
jgi:hypothetical protein